MSSGKFSYSALDCLYLNLSEPEVPIVHIPPYPISFSTSTVESSP